MTLAVAAIGGVTALAAMAATAAVWLVRGADGMHDINFDDEEQQS